MPTVGLQPRVTRHLALGRILSRTSRQSGPVTPSTTASTSEPTSGQSSGRTGPPSSLRSVIEMSPYTSSAPRSTKAPNGAICLTLTRTSEPGTKRRSTSSCVRVGSDSNDAVPCNELPLSRVGQAAGCVDEAMEARAVGRARNAHASRRPAVAGSAARSSGAQTDSPLSVVATPSGRSGRL